MSSHLDNFLEMLKSVKADHEVHEYLKDGRDHYDVTLFFGKGYNVPHVEFVFDYEGNLVKMDSNCCV